jgi:COMPASS component SPP1
MTMGIAEKIKSEGRARKAPSAAPSSDRGTPAPTPAKKANSPAPPPPPKMDKPPKKKGTAAHVKKSTQKSKTEGILNIH